MWNLLTDNVREQSLESFKKHLTEDVIGQITFGSLATGRARFHKDYAYY